MYNPPVEKFVKGRDAPKEGGKAASKEEGKGARREGRLAFLSIFVFLLAAGLVGWIFVKNQGALSEEFQYEKLPPAMPRVVPFPKNVLSVEKVTPEDYTYSIKGSEADKTEHEGTKYTVEAKRALAPAAVRDFYNKFMLDKGFRQRTSISMPNGHYLELENEKNLVSFEIEKKRNDSETRVKIIVYD